MHVQMAVANDVPVNHVREAILQSAIEAGHTGTLVALSRFKEVCGKIGRTVPPDERILDGDHSFDYFAGTKTMDADLSRQWHAIMSTHWSRLGLSVKERVYVSLTCNLLQGVLGTPFRYHVRLARDHGAGNGEIRALFRFLSEYGFSRSWAAIDALAAVA
jgi:alkylhydroperoxidase/carboxymuconolactone decarboxylase family protein YurZ